MAENLEQKSRRAVLEIRDKVEKMAEIMYDLGLKISHILEHRPSQYTTLPQGIDYDEYEI
jgi:hypothetical protein